MNLAILFFNFFKLSILNLFSLFKSILNRMILEHIVFIKGVKMNFNTRYDFNDGCCNRNNFDNNFNNFDIQNNDFNNRYNNYEDLYCCPSYYKEDRKENHQRKCWEGTFRICEPSYCDKKKEENHNCKQKCFSLCNLFRNCCRW